MSAGAKPRPRTTGNGRETTTGLPKVRVFDVAARAVPRLSGGRLMGEPIEALAAIIAKVAAPHNPNRSTGTVGTRQTTGAPVEGRG